MAFPTIQAADTQNGVQASNATSWTLTYPTNLASGDLILAFLGIDGSYGTGGTFPAGWVAEGEGSVANSLIYAKKLSDGTETGNFTWTAPGNEQGGWRIFRITDWAGTLGTSFLNDANAGAVCKSAQTSGASANPDPASLDPFNWGVEDTLWFAVCSVDTSRTISVYPLPDNNTADVSGGAGGATLGVCTTNSTVASLDPGTFTISASDDWDAITVGVRPVLFADMPSYTVGPRIGY